MNAALGRYFERQFANVPVLRFNSGDDLVPWLSQVVPGFDVRHVGSEVRGDGEGLRVVPAGRQTSLIQYEH